MNFLNSRSNNFLDKGQKAGIIAIALAELCKGSTPDSDSVCEGSNPSSAAKNTKHPSGASYFYAYRDSNRRGIEWPYCGWPDPRLTEPVGESESFLRCHDEYRICLPDKSGIFRVYRTRVPVFFF